MARPSNRKGATMGYTHYWTQTRDFTPEEFVAITENVGRIFATGKVALANGSGDRGTKPEIGRDKIWFNGVAPNGNHETMAVERKREEPYPGGSLGWAFCKTARKPYDKVVTAVLAYLAACCGYEVTSDGEPEDWADGVALAKKALPGLAYAIVCPIKA